VAVESMAGRANQKLRTRNAIVAAAAELSRTGREVTIPEVARAALVSEATAYRYFPDLVGLLREAIAEQLPTPEEALEPVADSVDPVVRIAVATEFLLRHVLSRQGVVRALIAATITRPSQARARPGLRFGVIDSALAPLNDTLGATDPAAMAQVKRDLAVVVSAEALFSLTDLHGLDPEEAITSIIHTATTLTRAASVSRGKGRELCARARVTINEAPENRTGRRRRLSPASWLTAHPSAAPGPREKLAVASCVDPRRSARRLGLGSRQPAARGRSPHRLHNCAGLSGMLSRPPCPAFHRRSLWLNQASAKRALAVPPRGSRDASATVATSSRFSPEPSVRSRRPLGTAA